mmetsp:Transcript_37289/g.119844  ORF Transcript_37289/g.119844 Transcript_37289/m.119844 type:complete len:237 (-) Transcript_37289:76-786(-)
MFSLPRWSMSVAMECARPLSSATTTRRSAATVATPSATSRPAGGAAPPTGSATLAAWTCALLFAATVSASLVGSSANRAMTTTRLQATDAAPNVKSSRVLRAVADHPIAWIRATQSVATVYVLALRYATTATPPRQPASVAPSLRPVGPARVAALACRIRACGATRAAPRAQDQTATIAPRVHRRLPSRMAVSASPRALRWANMLWRPSRMASRTVAARPATRVAARVMVHRAATA